jgi:hypothetical protein
MLPPTAAYLDRFLWNRDADALALFTKETLPAGNIKLCKDVSFVANMTRRVLFSQLKISAEIWVFK